MIANEDIQDPLSSAYPDAGSLDEYTNDSLRAVIKKNTIMPVRTMVIKKMENESDT